MRHNDGARKIFKSSLTEAGKGYILMGETRKQYTREIVKKTREIR